MKGIHPQQLKLGSTKQIKEFPIVDRYIVLLSQHTGSPSKPIVEIGNQVLKGQKIAIGTSKISANIHAPTSGKVIDITQYTHPTIMSKVPAIVIESDGKDQPATPLKSLPDYFRYSSSEIINIIYECGIVGLGGAMFPTHIKLSPPKEINTIILNGCECEPYITCDDRLMQEYSREIIDGLKIMMYVLNVSNAIVAIEDNKPEAIRMMRNIIFNEPNIHLSVLKTIYPQGAEKNLIKTLTGKEVPPGGLPFDVGIIVQNVHTAYSINLAVKHGLPLISRAVTVHNGTSSDNYWIRIGTPINEILKHCEIKNYSKIVLGGPMTGISQVSIDTPIIKGTSAVLLMDTKENFSEYYSCIKCGRCVRSCPMNLLPYMLSITAENKAWDETKNYYPMDCTECGICTYVCPAKRPIVVHIKQAKKYAR